MAFYKNADYIVFTGFLTVTFLILPLASTENIDCKGKAFHCVNSTHFKICVDFGGGISKTVDEFLIPCPINTVCRDINIFECEQQVTTTLVPIRPSDVTNEQAELDVPTLFPEYKTIEMGEFKNYDDSSITTTELSSSVAFTDTTDYISSTTLDVRSKHGNFSSESNMQNSGKSDLSDSATVSYAPASSFGLLSTGNEFLTTIAKVTPKNYLLNALHTNTTNSSDDLSLATTVQIFEGVTERNVHLESINSLDVNVSNNNEYNNTNNILITQTDSLFTPSEIFENTYSAETFSVTHDSTNYSKTLITPSILNIENVANDSSINLLNYDTTTNSYNISREQTTNSDSSGILNSTYNYELLSTATVEPMNNEKLNFTIGSNFNLMDDVTMSTNALYTITENTLNISLTNALITDNKTNINHDTNRTETLFTNSSTVNESSTRPVKEFFENINENLIIESSTPYDSVDNLITLTTTSGNRQSFENNVTVKNTTDLYKNTTNNSADMSPISHIPYTNTSTESNPTTLYVSAVAKKIFNLTIITNQSLTNNLLTSNTSSDHLSLNLDFINDHTFKEEVTTSNILLGNIYNDSTENNIQKIKNDTDLAENNTTSVINSATIPTLLNASKIDVTSYSSTTINYASISEHYQSITTVNPETYQNQEIYSSSRSQSLSDFLNKKIVSTTIIYYSQDIVTHNDKNITDDFPYLENENKTLENINVTEVTQSEKYSVALINITNKNFDRINKHTSPVIATTETISFYPFTTRAFKESNTTYLNETMLRASNITENNITLYTIKEQAPKNVIESVLPTSQVNEEYEVFNVSLNNLNKTINYSFTNGDSMTKTTLPLLKQKFATSKPYENETKTDIRINDIISTTEAATSVTHSNLLLTGYVESKDNLTNSDIHNNLLFIHLNTSKNMQDYNIGNEEAVTESNTYSTNSSYFSTKITVVPFENIYEANTLDLVSNHQNVTQTTSHALVSEKNNTDMLNTKSNYVNENNEQIGEKNILYNASFWLSQNFKSSISDTDLKYNSALLSKQNLTNNETMIQVFEPETNRNKPLNNYDYFLEKDRQQDTYKNKIKKQSIPTTTSERFSSQVIPKAPDRSNQTTLFTCLNRDRGKYSDKNNCNKFYICIGKLKPIIGMCPVDTVFSEINKQCTKNLSHCIRNNQFRCLSSGRFIDVLLGEFYYVCVKNLDGYVRFKLQCQRGYHLNKERIQCSSELTSIENFSKTTSDKSTDEKRSKEMKYSQKYETQFNCENEGKFEHPDDCRKYFICTKGSKSKFRRKIKKCDSDEVFNKEKRKCVDSESYEC